MTSVIFKQFFEYRMKREIMQKLESREVAALDPYKFMALIDR